MVLLAIKMYFSIPLEQGLNKFVFQSHSFYFYINKTCILFGRIFLL